MRILTRALLALVLTFSLTSVGVSAHADVDIEGDPQAYGWAVGPCEPENPVDECASMIMDEVVASIDQSMGICSFTNGRCTRVVQDEAEFWTHIDTWQAAQAALASYIDYRKRRDLWDGTGFDNSAGKALSQKLVDKAQAWVDKAFDSTTHAFDATVPPKGPIDPLPTITYPTPTKSFTSTPTPKISGTVKVGKTLKVKPGTWKPSGIKLSYQWYRNGKKIDGATKSSYKLVGSDKGKKVTVKVTGSKSGYKTVAKTSKATKKVAAGTLKKGSVKVTGSKVVGSTLTAKLSKWSPDVTVKYQWYRGSKKIKGATKATYTLVGADKGKKVTVKVKVSKTGYKTVAKKSKATAKIKTGSLKTAPVTITGLALVGKVLTVNKGTWTPSNVKFSYQWYRNGKAIKDATKATYTLVGADKGKKITVKVTGKKAGYKTAGKTSPATEAVVLEPPVVDPPPEGSTTP